MEKQELERELCLAEKLRERFLPTSEDAVCKSEEPVTETIKAVTALHFAIWRISRYPSLNIEQLRRKACLLPHDSKSDAVGDFFAKLEANQLADCNWDEASTEIFNNLDWLGIGFDENSYYYNLLRSIEEDVSNLSNLKIGQNYEDVLKKKRDMDKEMDQIKQQIAEFSGRHKVENLKITIDWDIPWLETPSVNLKMS